MDSRPDSATAGSPTATGVLDRKSLRLARAYARALLDRVGDFDRCQQVTDEMHQAWALMQASPEFSAMYTAGLAGRAALRDLIHRVFDGRCSAEVSAFLALMAHRCQGHLVGEVVGRMRAIMEDRGGYVDLTVTTAIELNEERRERISRQLGEALQVRPKVRWSVDRNLLGGMIVQMGDRQFDASTATRLRKLIRGLAHRFVSTS